MRGVNGCDPRPTFDPILPTNVSRYPPFTRPPMPESPDEQKARLFRRFVEQAGEWTDRLMLSRMRLRGYWPASVEPPADPPDEASERRALSVELRELRKNDGDAAKLLAAERKRRWQESKDRRAARKAERAAEGERRRAAWEETRQAGAPYLGDGVSGGLDDATSDAAKLDAAGLPVWHAAADVAAGLDLTLSRLRWLTYHRRGAAVVHYHRYDLPKPGGGARCISAPKADLKAAQSRVLDLVLRPLPVHGAAHGFVAGRDIFTNAAAHAGRPVVVNLDLRDFFGSIQFPRVRGVFKSLGYSGQASTVLALLCTEPPRVRAELPDGRVVFAAVGDRRLPQGAPTSPAVTNRLCRRLDRRLTGHAAALGFAYTRYADDLTFSSDDPAANVGRLLGGVRRIVAGESLDEQPAKTRVMRPGDRQEVTGLTVNAVADAGGDAPPARLPRDERRRLRATLHNAARHGLASQNRGGRPDFAAHLAGRVAHACRCDPPSAGEWQRRLADALREE